MITLTRQEEAPTFELPGLEFTGMASPSRGSADVCTWRLTIAVELTSQEAHTLDRDEVFMVSRGHIKLGPDAETIGPGDVAVVTAGSPIQVSNDGSEQAEVIVAIRADFTATAADGAVIGTPPWAV